MAIQDDQAFLDNYVALMTSVWSDKAAEAKLKADPTSFAIAAGLPVEDGATVILDQSPSEGLLAKEVLIGDWTKDAAAPVLHVPATALVDLAELSDSELEQVSGGVTVIIACYVKA